MAKRKGGRYTAPRTPAPREEARGRRISRRQAERLGGWALVLFSPVLVRLGPAGVLIALALAGAGGWLVRRSRPAGPGWTRRATAASVITAPWAARFWPWLDGRREVDRQRGRFRGGVAILGLASATMAWPMLVATGFYGALSYGGVVPGVLGRCWLFAGVGAALAAGARALAARFLPILSRPTRIALRVAVVSGVAGVILSTTAIASQAGQDLRRPGVRSVGYRSLAPILLPSAGRPFSSPGAPYERFVALYGGDEEVARREFELVAELASHDLWLVHTHADEGLWAFYDRTAGEAVVASPLLFRR